ncbi:polycomb group RING finger protein 1 isoform X3 [Rousettus aegyptiacus]|uniref:polycomb group RING finger protein 1 isoform X3 n=1 Tax=Rousettus aegyptiacus TaxID=9407 RepID=UPI00168D8621|nr:polycomb group RING finger protein 1 isoform X3 [Rousettus aegyptiacus]
MASPQGGQIAIAMRLRNQLQSVYKMDPLRNEEEVRVKIKDLNEHIVCCLCAGYFVDATTITECLHTFCKSCIVKYLQTSKYCPMCNIKIHETQPLLNLKLDRVMQDIVYKLVPGLQDSEEKRIREFYQSRGLDRVTQPSGEEPALSNLGLPFSTFDHSKAHYYRYDEQLSLCLERLSSGKDKNKSILQVRDAEGRAPLKRLTSLGPFPHTPCPVPFPPYPQNKYVRCSVRAEVRHLRRVLCHRLMLNPQHVQLLFDNEILPDHMTMKQIWLSRWFGKKSSECHQEEGPSMNDQRRGVEDPTHVKLRSIADILGPRKVLRGSSVSQLPESSPGPMSPLCALEELTSKAFHGLDGHAPQPSEEVPGSLRA